MIFYFTGTGNSLYVARNIAQCQEETLIPIAKEIEKNKSLFEYQLKENELLGFVFPIYAWGPPKIVLNFIDRLSISGSKPYVFYVSTCGDEEGNTCDVIQKKLSKKGLNLSSAFTLAMPGNYMVGFNIESNEIIADKLEKSKETLKQINTLLKERQKGVFQIKKGKGAWLKSGIINLLFNGFALNASRFYATDKCTGCKICEKVCPIHTITVENKPVWKKECTQCFGCINNCPVQAIEYGKATIGKGRYVHPEYRHE